MAMNSSGFRGLVCGIAACVIGSGCASTSQSTTRKPTTTTTQSTGAKTATSPTREGLGAPLTQLEGSQMREQAIAVLERAAFDPWAQLRANAIEGLQAAPARAEPITRAGLADDNPGVRFVAAMTVGQLRMESLGVPVAQLMRDRDALVVAAAIYALVRLGEDPDRTPLATLLMQGDAHTRANAAFILGELGDPTAAPMLRDAAKRLATPGGDPTIGPSASRLLRLHVAAALVKLGDTEMVQTLRAALYPSLIEEMEGAVLAAQLLGEIKDEGAIAQLVKVIEYRVGGRDDRTRYDGEAFLYPIELRLAAATSLAKMGQPDGLFVGLMSETNPAPEVRAQITFLYSAVGGPPAARKLALMLEDSDPQVQVAAAANLIRTLDRRGTASAAR